MLKKPSFRKSTLVVGTAVAALLIAEACRKPEPLAENDYNEWLSGGTQTVFDAGSGAFSQPFPELDGISDALHETGDLAFEAPFVSAPALLRPGLGPVFNSVSCANCHVADGRGRPPGANEPMISMLMRISIAGTDPHGGPAPVPGFGTQLQQRAIIGRQPEADVLIAWTEIPGQYADGTPYSLRMPTYSLQNAYTTMPAGVMLSPRMAPPVFGLGLLEAVDESTLLQAADEFDSDGDGISGRPNYVWNLETHQLSIGRFGWKSGAPSLMQQSASAYAEDMGITNYLFPQESCFGQPQYDGLNDETEITDSLLFAASFYVRTLAVPARRNLEDPQVIRGKQLFIAANCSGCHTPRLKTGTVVGFAPVSSQTIFPYSDLLLHDMGTDLADNRPDFLASGNEWRTAPLWGIGLTQTVNGHSYYMHDGRARSLEEAILWHGGEATNSRSQFVSMPATDRAALIAFLQSL
jgi:CxxC motif-containing protein (DUF1111 family)